MTTSIGVDDACVGAAEVAVVLDVLDRSQQRGGAAGVVGDEQPSGR